MNCPHEVGTWIKNARKGDVQAVNYDTFAKLWLQWWANINPKWRERAGDYLLQSSQDGDWTAMAVPGQNGFLSVFATLVTLIKGPNLELARYAVGDVQWVVEQVTTAVRAGRIR